MSLDIILFEADRNVDLEEPLIEDHLLLLAFNNTMDIHDNKTEKAVDFCASVLYKTDLSLKLLKVCHHYLVELNKSKSFLNA